MEHLFTKLKTTGPSNEFKARSRTLILSSAQHQPQTLSVREIGMRLFRSSAAFAMAAAMIFLLAGGLSQLNRKFISPAVLSSLDPASLNKEVQNFNISIQIAQVKYYDDAPKKVAVALGATSGELQDQANRKSQLQNLLNDPSL